MIPGFYEQCREKVRERYVGECEDCGSPAWTLTGSKKNVADGRMLCTFCRGVARRTCVVVDEIDGTPLSVKCVTCKEWKSPDEFGRGSRYRDLRDGGFCGSCRPCATRLRSDYRERNKVPCQDCGTRVEGKGRGNAHAAADRPFLCQPCWRIRTYGK